MSAIASKKIMGVLTHLWRCGLFSISRKGESLGELTVRAVGMVDGVISEQPQKKKKNKIAFLKKNKTEKHFFEG